MKKNVYVVPNGKITYSFNSRFWFYEEYLIYDYDANLINYFDYYFDMMEWIKSNNLNVLNANGTIYFDEEEVDEENVLEIFSRCKITILEELEAEKYVERRWR